MKYTPLLKPEAALLVEDITVDGVAQEEEEQTVALDYTTQIASLHRQIERLRLERKTNRPSAGVTRRKKIEEEDEEKEEGEEKRTRSEESADNESDSEESGASSLSSSSEEEEEEEDEEDDEEGTGPQRGNRLFFTSKKTEERLSVYKDILPSRADCPLSVTRAELKQLTKHIKWAVVLLNAGHFAGAIIENGNVTLHKTFHRYVVRAKRGTLQSTRDNKSGTSAPKSMGASLRRHNETMLGLDIQNLFESWRAELDTCEVIFTRVAPTQKSVFFYDNKGASSPLQRGDLRVRSVPFATKRPTQTEISRIFSMLAAIYHHDDDGKEESFSSKGPSPRAVRKDLTGKGSSTHPSDSTSRSLRGDDIDESDEADKKKKKKKKKGNQASSSSEPPKGSLHDGMEPPQATNPLYEACESGAIRVVRKLLNENPESVALVNATEGNPNNNTCLHVAALKGFRDICFVLLGHGADPTINNAKKQTPYVLAQGKETMQVFSRFRESYPDAFDYSKTMIPGPLSTEMIEEKRLAEEAQKKKKAEKKKTAQKEKELIFSPPNNNSSSNSSQPQRKVVEKPLDARELRAQAAMNRLKLQQNEDTTVSSTSVPQDVKGHCDQCKKAIVGKEMMFSRYDYKYCSMACLTKHKEILGK